MKPYKVTVGIKKTRSGYDVYNLRTKKSCWLCGNRYEMVIGKEVLGKVTFVMRKINRAGDYIFPFRIFGDDLEIRYGRTWDYAKSMGFLNDVFDIDKLKEWAGKSNFSVEMEFLK